MPPPRHSGLPMAPGMIHWPPLFTTWGASATRTHTWRNTHMQKMAIADRFQNVASIWNLNLRGGSLVEIEFLTSDWSGLEALTDMQPATVRRADDKSRRLTGLACTVSTR